MTNERPGTDHVISGPMRGLKNASDGADKQTDIHCLLLFVTSGHVTLGPVGRETSAMSPMSCTYSVTYSLLGLPVAWTEAGNELFNASKQTLVASTGTMEVAI